VAISVQYDECSEEFQVKDELAGKKVLSTACNAVTRVRTPMRLPSLMPTSAESICSRISNRRLGQVPAVQKVIRKRGPSKLNCRPTNGSGPVLESLAELA
jgi:hypothetical protein